jgi:hypothetical protein
VQNLRLAMPALPTLRYGKAGKAGTDGHEIYQELNALTKPSYSFFAYYALMLTYSSVRIEMSRTTSHRPVA